MIVRPRQFAIGSTRIMLVSKLYMSNMYVFPRFEVTGNRPAKYVWTLPIKYIVLKKIRLHQAVLVALLFRRSVLPGPGGP